MSDKKDLYRGFGITYPEDRIEPPKPVAPAPVKPEPIEPKPEPKPPLAVYSLPTVTTAKSRKITNQHPIHHTTAIVCPNCNGSGRMTIFGKDAVCSLCMRGTGVLTPVRRNRRIRKTTKKKSQRRQRRIEHAS